MKRRSARTVELICEVNKMSRYIDAECDCVKEIINRRVFNSREDIQDFLDNIPTVDVAPIKHGDWITWAEAGNWIPSENRHECSYCHDVAQVLINGVELLSEYCPNCGAKMDGKSNYTGELYDWD